MSLTRESTGLSSAHKDLIRLLAEIAVGDYLAEIEAVQMIDETDGIKELKR